MRHTRIRAAVAALALGAGAVVAVPSAAPAASPDNPYAVVSAAGGLVSGSGATGVSVLGSGQYEVTFSKKVSPCAFTATPATSGVLVFVAGGHLSVKGVYVETKNLAGGLSAAPFHLAVWCNSTNRRAVVAADGTLVRGRKVASVTAFAQGGYSVNFTSKTTGCIPVATIGDTANGLVFNPGVIIAGAPSLPFRGKNVGVDIRDPAFFGGAESARPFHLTVVCDYQNQRFATVKFNGTLDVGSVGVSTSRTGVGNYHVVFPSSITGCATTAVANGSEVDHAGPVWVAPSALDGGSVDVHATDLDGTAGDHNLSLIVSC